MPVKTLKLLKVAPNYVQIVCFWSYSWYSGALSRNIFLAKFLRKNEAHIHDRHIFLLSEYDLPIIFQTFVSKCGKIFVVSYALIKRFSTNCVLGAHPAARYNFRIIWASLMRSVLLFLRPNEKQKYLVSLHANKRAKRQTLVKRLSTWEIEFGASRSKQMSLCIKFFEQDKS